MPDEEEGQPDGEDATDETAPENENGQVDQPAESEFTWKGRRLDEMGGAQVGKVEGQFVDDVTGRLEWLLARMGRFGHYCLVPARDAVTANGRVWVPYTRDQIRRAPRVEPGKPLERDAEQAMLDHYGVGAPQTGRAAELSERKPGAETSQPADS